MKIYELFGILEEYIQKISVNDNEKIKLLSLDTDDINENKIVWKIC